MDEEILAEVGASGARRVFGLAVLVALGCGLLWLALAPQPVAFALRLLMLALAAAVFWSGWKMYRATEMSLVLTDRGLRDSSGTVIAPMAEIASVDRGTFAFKPSNGFLLRMTQPGAAVIRPGLYWRIGRRAGIGGVLNAAETKVMADRIAVICATRAAPETAQDSGA